jgi:hypothetical protein
VSQQDDEVIQVPLTAREIETIVNSLRSIAADLRTKSQENETANPHGVLTEAAGARETLAEELDQVVVQHFTGN